MPLLVLAILTLVATPEYGITDLQLESVGPCFLNDRGTVAGNTRENGKEVAFLWNGRRKPVSAEMKILGLNRDDVLAVHTKEGPGRWSAGKLQTVPKPDGGTPIGIDDDLNLYLLSTWDEGLFGFWTWPQTKKVGEDRYPVAVAPDGAIVGGKRRGRVPPFKEGPIAFFVLNGKTTAIGDRSVLATPTCISRGHAVGGSYTIGGERPAKPFLWKDGKLAALRLDEGWQGSVSGVNDHGEAVGEIVRDSEHHLNLWKDDVVFRLEEITEGAKDYELGEALAINQKGQILVTARLTSQPYPGTLLLLTPKS